MNTLTLIKSRERKERLFVSTRESPRDEIALAHKLCEFREVDRD